MDWNKAPACLIMVIEITTTLECVGSLSHNHTLYSSYEFLYNRASKGKRSMTAHPELTSLVSSRRR